MDKRDINWAKMPTFCEKKLSACRKFIFIFFMHLRKICTFFISLDTCELEIGENPANLCQVMNSLPQIEGLGVISPPFSDFRGRTCWF